MDIMAQCEICGDIMGKSLLTVKEHPLMEFYLLLCDTCIRSMLRNCKPLRITWW